MSCINNVTSDLQQLIDDVLAGDSDAERQLFAELKSIALPVVDHHLSQPQFRSHVQDVVQESIWSAFRCLKANRDRFSKSEMLHSVIGWMKWITICRVHDFFRNWYHKNRIEMELIPLETLSSDEARRTAEQREIEAFIDSLDDGNLRDLAGCLLAGLNWMEAREILGLSERGMRHLRELLEKTIRDWLGLD